MPQCPRICPQHMHVDVNTPKRRHTEEHGQHGQHVHLNLRLEPGARRPSCHQSDGLPHSILWKRARCHLPNDETGLVCFAVRIRVGEGAGLLPRDDVAGAARAMEPAVLQGFAGVHFDVGRPPKPGVLRRPDCLPGHCDSGAGLAGQCAHLSCQGGGWECARVTY